MLNSQNQDNNQKENEPLNKRNTLESLNNFKGIIMLHKRVVIIFIGFIIILCAVTMFYKDKVSVLSESYIQVLASYNESEKQLTKAVDDNESLKKRLKEVAENNRHQEKQFAELSEKYYQSTDYNLNYYLGIYDMDSPLIVSADMEKGKIDFIIKHFKAMYSGDEETYKETLTSYILGVPQCEWLLSHVAEDSYYYAKVKFIAPVDGHIPVFVLTQKDEESEPVMNVYYTAISYTDGVWGVYDYD